MAAEIESSQETGLEVAVIGMAGRFPGANSIDEYWDNLKNSAESITFFSREELEKAGIEPHLLERPDYVKAGSILEEIEYFDASFFGYTPREAGVLDPQVRLFHECAWQALEDAGCNPDSYKGLIGVYAGASSNFPWQASTLLNNTDTSIDPFTAFQLKEKDFLCVHISYRLNLKGPSVLVSSACSTSLTAVIMACQGLLSGECDMALAGGSTVHIPQVQGYLYEEGKISSPDGHCRAFDAKAAGTTAGSGVGVVVLTLLEKAREDKHHIYALIKGSGINNDGVRKAGFTAPSVDGQAEVIRAAIGMADVPPESITYLEAHGTGTALGDPVEMEALKLAFDSNKKGFCAIGSVKTNFGHLDSAAGIAGFIKTVLALNHKLIPPTLHFEAPNPVIDFKDSSFYVNTKLQEWRNDQYPLRAGVSSFGIGGTNAHVILEEARDKEGTRGLAPLPNRQNQLVLLSAKTQTALDKMTENLVEYFKSNPGIDLADAAYTLQVGRKRFPHRRMTTCSSVVEAIETLSAPESLKRHTFYSTGDTDKQQLIFMFPGQGSQYVNMGLGLYQAEKVFKEEMDRCFEILKPLVGHDIKEILYPCYRSNGSNRSYKSYLSYINQTQIAQPVLFAFEYALAKLLMAWGITPYAMIGHSVGEYAAAHLSGVFSLEQALKLVALRGKLMQQMPPGAMLSVPLPESGLTTMLPEGICLAAVNSPGLCTVAGPIEAVSAFEKQMKDKGYDCRYLHTSHAFHSAMMDPIPETFQAVVKKELLHQPEIPYISNLSGDWITIDEAVDPDYWARQLRHTVRFGDGISRLLEEENALFLEVGPGMGLSTLVGKHPDKKPGQKTVNLVRHPKEKTADDEFLLRKTGQLWLYGVPLQWEGFYASGKRQRLSIPTYPFAKQRFPIEGQVSLPRWQSGARFPSTKRTDVGEWFYQPSWKRVQLPPPAETIPSPSPGWCLVFNNPEGGGATWGKLLEQEGLDIIEVKEGSEFSRESNRSFTLAPGEPEHYYRLFQHLEEENIVPRQILHLWNISNKDNMEDTIDRILDRAYYSLLYLARSVGKYNPEDALQLLVVSDHMQDVTGEFTECPEKSVLLGPVTTIPREYPNLRCCSIDIKVPPAGSQEEQALIKQLMWEMTAHSPDNVIAYRNNNVYWVRWARHPEPLRLPKPGNLSHRIKEGGVYLITGGLGGIGLVLAKYLASQAKVKLVLTGRSPLPPAARGSFEKPPLDPAKLFIKMGIEMVYFSADAADLQQMEEVVCQAEERLGPITGIIHCAGVADGGMIQRRTREMSEKVLAAKIKGTLNLDAIFKHRHLDFFVLCSAMSSFWSPFGQVAYTAANCFMDAYAHSQLIKSFCRGSRGALFSKSAPLAAGGKKKPVISINWDTWQQVGMAEEAVRKMAEAGNIDLEPDISAGILPAEGQEVFGRILAGALSSYPQVLVSTRDIQHPDLQGPGDFTPPPDFSIDEVLIGKSPKTVYQRPALSTEYVPPGTENEILLAGLLQNLLGIEQVGIFDNFFELGVSSLDVININNRLKKIPNLDISTVIIFENPTVQLLARYLDIKMKKETPEQGQEAVPERKDRSGEINTGKTRLQKMLKKTKET